MMGGGYSKWTVTGQTTVEKQMDTVYSTSKSFPNHVHPGETIKKNVHTTVINITL